MIMDWLVVDWWVTSEFGIVLFSDLKSNVHKMREACMCLDVSVDRMDFEIVDDF